MSSFVKTKLKNARDALTQKQYQVAYDAASQVLEYEPDNYNAHVFLGLASLELGQFDKSEQLYRKAIDLNTDQILAWQGISKLYERTQQWEKVADTLIQLMNMFSRSDDATKCAESLQRLIEVIREHGTRRQVIDSLSLLLPGSPVYATISTLPPPDPTNPTSTTTSVVQRAVYDSLPVLEDIVALTEKHEEEAYKSEFERQRTRLGASSPEQLRKTIGVEIWGSSQLPRLYDEILNHPNTSDELRRHIESKLLVYKQRYFYALPVSGDMASTKVKIAAELDDLVSGMITIGVANETAWTMFLDGKDSETVEGYGINYLRQYTELFAGQPLVRLLQAYFTYKNISLSEGEEGEDSTQQEDDDPYEILQDTFPLLSESILASQIMVDVYVQEEDHQATVKAAENGLELARRHELKTGRKLANALKALNVAMATGLVHLYPPKHHSRAIRILDEVLAQDPRNADSLISRGYIYAFASKWPEAETMFMRAVELLPGDSVKGLRAREEHAWCLSRIDMVAGAAALKALFDDLEVSDVRDFDRARCLWRIGRSLWDVGGSDREEAYTYFIKSLKYDLSYAPAYTSLGIYYSQHASPPDPIRASKCFQKAFELDPTEVEAARRLAESFADEREWDLVEVVARRTIEGEGGLEAGAKAEDAVIPGRYLSTNAWAWKAVGVVEITRRNYTPAIQAFQVALRTDPDDQLSWLRLGEAYSRAGRHAAAIKALHRAQELRPDDWICGYFIGEVQRQTCQFQEALSTFQTILSQRASEVGILMSVAQTYLDLGRQENSSGFITRAENSFIECVKSAHQVIETSPGYRSMAWKIIADAIFDLSAFRSFATRDSLCIMLNDTIFHLSKDPSNRLSGILVLPSISSDAIPTGLDALQVAVVAYDYRLTLCATHEHAKGSAWFDLGIALHTLSAKTVGEKQEALVKQAIECLTQCLREEPINPQYWNALGSVYFLTKPKSAQHAYIKALEFDSKNVVTWTNLGLLYLFHGDYEIANEALHKAQILDPDHTLAWVGQALVASGNGHEGDAQNLLQHAVGLAADLPEADLEYASRMFSSLLKMGFNRLPSYDSIFPLFALLDRCSKRRPDDAYALHLFGLVCERLGQLELGVDLIQRAIAILEALYEETEDAQTEQQFIIANSNLARLRISLNDHEGALQSFESALGLLPEEDTIPMNQTLRVHGLFGSGLARFRLGDLQAALTSLQHALEAAGDNTIMKGHITVLLAQTMWAIGTDEFRETAKAQLLDWITVDPKNLMAINTLAGMGILTGDDNLVDAALSEILSLPLERRYELDPRRDVDYLLIQHHLGQGDVAQALRTAQKALFVEPSNLQSRRNLASLTLQNGDPRSALAITTGGSTRTDDEDLSKQRESLALCAVAEAMEGGDSIKALRQAQKAVMLAPWDLQNWQILAFVRARSAK